MHPLTSALGRHREGADLQFHPASWVSLVFVFLPPVAWSECLHLWETGFLYEYRSRAQHNRILRL